LRRPQAYVGELEGRGQLWAFIFSKSIAPKKPIKTWSGEIHLLSSVQMGWVSWNGALRTRRSQLQFLPGAPFFHVASVGCPPDCARIVLTCRSRSNTSTPLRLEFIFMDFGEQGYVNRCLAQAKSQLEPVVARAIGLSGRNNGT
jgi:hypothetical protein